MAAAHSSYLYNDTPDDTRYNAHKEKSRVAETTSEVDFFCLHFIFFTYHHFVVMTQSVYVMISHHVPQRLGILILSQEHQFTQCFDALLLLAYCCATIAPLRLLELCISLAHSAIAFCRAAVVHSLWSS